MRRTTLVLAACLILLATAIPPATAASSPKTPDLQRVIVQLKVGDDLMRGLTDELTALHGGRTGATFQYAINGFVAELPRSAIAALANDPNVISISPDYPIRITAQETPTGFDRIEADLVPRTGVPLAPTCPSGSACTDVDIAIIDTGVADHADLNVVHRVDCSSILGSCTSNSGWDGNGHGTHVAGIAAAIDNDFGVIGVAPGARIWSVKVLGDDGVGFLSSLIAGIDWVTGHASEIDVANMSLTGEFSNSTFNSAVSNSIAAGIVYAVGAGNSSADAAAFSPASHPDVIAVSALADADGAGGGLGVFLNRPAETDDTLATFSNYGAVVDIAAPGVNIRSTWNDGGYAIKSGTSMASPQAAGAAALYIALHGRDTNNDTLVNGADVAKLMSDLLLDAKLQSDPCGFGGDPDTYPEPLLTVNGTAFGGNETCTVAGPDPSLPVGPASFTAVPDGFSVQIDWDEASDPESGILSYQLWRDTVPASGEALVTETNHTVRSHLDRPEPGTVFSYEINAVNRQGISGPRTGPIVVTVSDEDRTDAGWWSLDDGAGLVAVDGTAWHRDGVLVGDGAWDPVGKIGGALSFDGTDDRVDLDSTILDGATDATVALWVRTAKTGIQAFVSGANSGNDAEFELIPISDTAVRFYTGESSATYVLWNVSSFADNQWHHFAVTRDDGNDQATLFIDGVSKGIKTTTMGALTIDPGGLLLGQEQDSVGGGFDASQAFVGTMDEVRLYTRLLTNQEINDLAMRDITEPSAPAALTARANDNAIDLSWPAADDPESGIAAYEISRGAVAGGDKARVTEVAGTQTYYRDTAVVADTDYFYEVVAVNGATLTGQASPEATAKSGSATPADAGWWSLDDGAGLVAVDGTAWHRDGALAGDGAWDPVGKVGGALSFDGTDDRVDLDSTILDGATDATVALWVRTAKTGIQAFVSGANSGNDAEFELIPISDTAVRFYTGESSATYVLWNVSSFADNQWHHFAVTRDDGNDQATLFIDGVSKGIKTTTMGALTIDPGGLLLGQEQDSVGGGFDASQAFVGTMDEVRLYTRLLTNQEINDLAGLGVVDTAAPAAPAGLSAVAGDAEVTLDWPDNPESDLDSYTVWRAEIDGGPYAALAIDLTVSAFADTTVNNATTYYYVVSATDTSGNESGFSVQAAATPTAGTGPAAIDFLVNPVLSYGGSQDKTGNVEILDGGATLRLTGNLWKKIAYPYTITPNTMLEFDFSSATRGEIHGIGFDTDDGISSNRTFELFGSQTWGIQNFRTYDSPDGVVHYEIPIGQYYTGSFASLFFTNDHDISSPTGESTYTNITIYEQPPPPPVVIDFLVNPVLSYGGSQDKTGNVEILDGGATLRLTGNLWKKIAYPYTITPNTMLEFDFSSATRGEIHGIGFDTDDGISSNRTFELFGSQTWGIQNFRTYDSPDGVVHYEIPIGQYYTGSFASLFFTNDHDISSPTGESTYTNITIYQGG